MRRRAWLSVGAIAAILGACPEPEVCTQAGCGFGPWIYIVDDGTGGPLRGGTYAFRVESEHLHVEWTCALGPGDPPDSACDHDLSSYAEIDGQSVVWHGQAIHGPDGLAIELVEIHVSEGVFTGPASLSIEVTRDGAPVAAQHDTPEYVLRMLNDDCGPTCGHATEDVVVHVPA